MSLFPGDTLVKNGVHVLDDDAMSNSMAQTIENEMARLLKNLKGIDALPATGEEDRRLLVVAISRGILRYLKENQGQLIQSLQIRHPADAVDHTVSDLNLDIKMNR